VKDITVDVRVVDGQVALDVEIPDDVAGVRVLMTTTETDGLIAALTDARNRALLAAPARGRA